MEAVFTSWQNSIKFKKKPFNKMKLNIIIFENPFVSSSAWANRLLSLIEGLNNIGVYVYLLFFGPFRSKNEVSYWKTEGEYRGIRYNYIYPLIVEGYWNVRFYNYIGEKFIECQLQKSIIKELEKNEGIIWTDSSHFGFKLAVQLKKRIPNRKLFIEMSEFLDVYKYNSNSGNFLQRWEGRKRQNFFDKTAFHVYDGMALMTKTLYKHYEQFKSSKPKLLHLPMTVDLDRFSTPELPLPEFKKPYIAYVGVMNNAKDGVNILIQAFAKVHILFPNFKLYLIGPWHYDTPSQLKMIKDLNLSDRVFWMNEYPRDNIPKILLNADLLVLPRPLSRQALGGFPTKLGEYLASGIPVCATKVGEIPDYLVDEESVFFAEPGSVESLADSMFRALSNPIKAKDVGKNGRKVAEKYFNKDIQAVLLYNFLMGL